MHLEKNNPNKILKKLEEDEHLKRFIWDEKELNSQKAFPMDINDNLFFYGLLIPKNVTLIDRKGESTFDTQKSSPCLITSDRKLHEFSLAKRNELKIDFETIPSFLPQRWKLEKIKIFLLDRDEPVNPRKLLDKITEQYKKYLYIKNPLWYSIHALWDLGTYVYQIFEVYPIFELQGLPQTGKSKEMTISSFIAFNAGEIMVNPSESTLFRETEEVKGAKYFDEAEKLWNYNPKTKQFEGDIRTELLNASYSKAGKVPRQEKIGNRYITKWYSPFSPTQVSSINGLHGATETRAITRITTKSLDEDTRGEKEPLEDRKLPIWEEIRDESYRFGLSYWNKILEIYQNFPEDCPLKKRDLQIWKPILSLAKFIDLALYEEIVKFAQNISNQRRDDFLSEDSFDYGVLSALRNCILNGLRKIYIEDIKLAYFQEQGELEGNFKYVNRNISNRLDKLGFREFRSRDGKASFFSVSGTDFNEIISTLSPKLLISSPSSTTSTQIHINEEKKNVDGVVIGVDKTIERSGDVVINGDNGD